VILGVDKKPLASYQAPVELQVPVFEYEHPVLSQPIDADFFDSASQPHMPRRSSGGSKQNEPGVLVGYVRVSISPVPLLAAKYKSIYSVLVLSCISASLGAVFGLILARRIERPLGRVMHALGCIRQGHYDVDLKEVVGGELGELQKAVANMAQALASHWQQLEEKVAQRTEELQKANSEKAKLIAYSNMLLEAERKRIALDIHDQLNPSLIAVRLAASALASDGGKPLSQEEIKAFAADIVVTTDEIYANARRIVKSLRPEIIDTLGFQEAITELVRQFNHMQNGCRFDVDMDVNAPRLSGDLAMTAYRVVQEALSNVVKHAKASNCIVSLKRVADRRVRVSIKDDGFGFDAKEQSNEGVGLIGIKERTAYYGGGFYLSSDSSGSEIAVEFDV
jgi:two-component system sensor histidine kinase UhpB